MVPNEIETYVLSEVEANSSRNDWEARETDSRHRLCSRTDAQTNKGKSASSAKPAITSTSLILKLLCDVAVRIWRLFHLPHALRNRFQATHSATSIQVRSAVVSGCLQVKADIPKHAYCQNDQGDADDGERAGFIVGAFTTRIWVEVTNCRRNLFVRNVLD